MRYINNTAWTFSRVNLAMMASFNTSVAWLRCAVQTNFSRPHISYFSFLLLLHLLLKCNFLRQILTRCINNILVFDTARCRKRWAMVHRKIKDPHVATPAVVRTDLGVKYQMDAGSK